jgi:CheY-like chemotaxis protein
MLQDEEQPPKRILLVADDPAHAQMLSQVISRETAHHVFLAPNSQAALRFVTQQKPNLFLVDCRRSFEHGIQLYRQLHAQPGLEAIPAIILTASLQHYADDIQALSLIALSTPFDLDDFLYLLEEVLRSSS